jgi:hypothetical protein
LQTLLEEVLQHDEDGANGLMFDEANDTMFGDDDIDFDELGDLKLPVSCSRSTSCLSLNSDGLGAIFEADDSSTDSWMNSIARTGGWMADDDVVKCVDGTEEVAVENPAREVVETTDTDLAAVLPRIQNPTPSTPPSTGSSSITIPRPTREFLVEGMNPSSLSFSDGCSSFSRESSSFSNGFSNGDIKKQKIARYLEKRKRRLSRKWNQPVALSSTRRAIANKRARVNGRFVSVSEFGSAPKRRR